MNFYISSINPIKIFILSWAIWIFTYFIKPFDYTYENFTYDSFLIYFLLNLFFLIGIIFGNINKDSSQDNKFQLDAKQINKIFNVLLFLAIISCFFRLYSIFFIQNYFAYETSYDFKMSIYFVTSSGGVVGIISAITLPATLLSLYMNIIYNITDKKSVKNIIVFTASLLLVIDSVLKSAFLYIAIYFIFLLITLIIRDNYFKKKDFVLRLYVILPIIIALFIYFSYIYQFRIFDLTNTLYSRNIIPNSNVDNHFQFMLINFSHYILHGYYQWVDLYQIVGLKNYYLGMVEFYPILKFLKYFLIESIPSMDELVSVLPRGAVYYSFWGDFILDFGKLSFPLSFLLGYITSIVYQNLKKNYFISTIIYPFFLIQIFFIPFLNLLSGQFGYFVAFIIILKIILKFSNEKTNSYYT